MKRITNNQWLLWWKYNYLLLVFTFLALLGFSILCGGSELAGVLADQTFYRTLHDLISPFRLFIQILVLLLMSLSISLSSLFSGNVSALPLYIWRFYSLLKVRYVWCWLSSLAAHSIWSSLTSLPGVQLSFGLCIHFYKQLLITHLQLMKQSESSQCGLWLFVFTETKCYTHKQNVTSSCRTRRADSVHLEECKNLLKNILAC